MEGALTALPDNVQATVLARLDLLAPDERRVLQLGAVLGRTFRAGGVAALEPMLGDVSRHIDALLDKDLVRASAADTFVFRHILIREVAYQALSRTERARLHHAAGRWLEEFAASREDAFAELIAYHYREAASLSASLATDAMDAFATRERATSWLVRASDVALAGAAQQEASRHLRAAIEIADSDTRATLYEKLGDVFASGEAADHYRQALRIFRDLGGRDPDRELRLLAGALGVLTRSQGAVRERPTDEEMARVRAEGSELLTRATDQRAVARFLTANAFYPFWKDSRQPATPDEIAEAETSGRRALDIVTRLGDARMQSAAMDGIGSILMLRGDMRAARDLALQRLTLRDRLDLTELIDAWAMFTWTSVILGEFDEAIRVSSEALAEIQPGQAPSWTLHLAARRTEALALRGRWDEAVASGERMLLLWNEAERTSAGYALHGMVSAFGVARARRNDAAAERLREAMREIIAGFREPGANSRLAIAALDDVGTPDAVLLRSGYTLADNVDYALALYCDREVPIPESLLGEIESAYRDKDLPLVSAQLDRALGLAQRDAAQLGVALARFERCGAVPYAARAQIERALLTGDKGEYAMGVRTLEALGDHEQLERYERRRQRANA